MRIRTLARTGVILALGGCALLTARNSFAGQQAPTNTSDNKVVTQAALPDSSSLPATTKDDKTTPAVDASPSGAPSAELPVMDAKAYRIGIADELMISVWQEPELSGPVVVRPDGDITMPLVNDVAVVGLRTDELQKLLSEKLKPFVNMPQVTIIVRGIRSRKVYMVGKVARQGTFDLNDDKTVLELIGEAGGLGAFAKQGSIYILRTTNGKKTRIGFNYKSAIAGRGPNPVLQPGDLVVVP